MSRKVIDMRSDEAVALWQATLDALDEVGKARDAFIDGTDPMSRLEEAVRKRTEANAAFDRWLLGNQ